MDGIVWSEEREMRYLYYNCKNIRNKNYYACVPLGVGCTLECRV